MKQFIFLPIFLFSIVAANAQSITDVVAKQNVNSVIITYNLQCDGDANISLFVSEKGDDSFAGPLKNVSGDVGSGIKSGSRTIIWNALSEQEMVAGDKVLFRVVGVPKFGNLTDNRDNKTYKTVRIGDQIIMAENLNYNRGANWCYNNDIENCNRYGRLYDWETSKNICPSGWHLPNKEEFESLLQNAGSSGSSTFNSVVTGGSCGFSALFGGYRDKYETYLNFGANAYFWSSVPNGTDNAWHLSIGSKYMGANMMGNLDKQCGISVRCFRD